MRQETSFELCLCMSQRSKFMFLRATPINSCYYFYQGFQSYAQVGCQDKYFLSQQLIWVGTLIEQKHIFQLIQHVPFILGETRPETGSQSSKTLLFPEFQLIMIYLMGKRTWMITWPICRCNRSFNTPL